MEVLGLTLEPLFIDLVFHDQYTLILKKCYDQYFFKLSIILMQFLNLPLAI